MLCSLNRSNMLCVLYNNKCQVNLLSFNKMRISWYYSYSRFQVYVSTHLLPEWIWTDLHVSCTHALSGTYTCIHMLWPCYHSLTGLCPAKEDQPYMRTTTVSPQQRDVNTLISSVGHVKVQRKKQMTKDKRTSPSPWATKPRHIRKDYQDVSLCWSSWLHRLKNNDGTLLISTSMEHRCCSNIWSL